MNTQRYKGSCLCGGIRYEVSNVNKDMAHCHCTMCQKFHGAAFSTFGSAHQDNFRWLAGETLLKTFEASNGTKRRFCRNCGSSMTFESAQVDTERLSTIEFTLATLDACDGLQPDAHIYLSSKADWVELAGDGLTRHMHHRGTSTEGE